MSSEKNSPVSINSRDWKKAESQSYTPHNYQRSDRNTEIASPSIKTVVNVSTSNVAQAMLAGLTARNGAKWFKRSLIFTGLLALIGNVPVSSKLLETHSPSQQRIEIVLNGDNAAGEIAVGEDAVGENLADSSETLIETATKETAKSTPAFAESTVDESQIERVNPKISLRELIASETNSEHSDVPEHHPEDLLDEGPIELSLPGRALETYTGHVLPDTHSQWKTYKVKSYDNLTNIFHKIGHPELLKPFKKNQSIAKQLRSLKKGSIVRTKDLNGKLAELVLTHNKSDKKQLTSFVIKPKDAGFQGQLKQKVVEMRQARISFEIRNGLFFDARKAGISDQIVKQIVKVFDWDIDFSHDVRVGDTVTAIYEEIYHDGDKIDNRNLLAAEFINKGKSHRAIRYTFKNGKSDFFTPDGREMKKAFIRTPIAHARVSSHFNPGRFHPKLHKIRAHKGTDFAARPGTSIMATGNGKIKFIGRKGGYGRTVIIEHREGYTTLYAHLSRYKKGLRKGDTVIQGDVIGYVGSSGLATGPHLHYEFRHHDKPVNPMTVALPNSMSLSPRELKHFRQEAVNMVLQLNVLHRFAEAKIDINSAVGG